jgi:TM2 domain-containing membrane protein YozV
MRENKMSIQPQAGAAEPTAALQARSPHGMTAAEHVVAMRYDANKKSMGVAYLLWFFLGGFGGHRFYIEKTGSAVAMLIMTILGLATLFVFIGGIILPAVGIWVLVDAFLIPGWIREQNNVLIDKLSR